MSLHLAEQVATQYMERLSLHDPRFNVREIVKNLLLLEDHLVHPDRFCPDCIMKHLLLCEALADEASCLDKSGLWCSALQGVAEQTRVWSASLSSTEVQVIGQEVRGLRKMLMPLVTDLEGLKQQVIQGRANCQ